MVYGAIDLHLRYSQVRIIDTEGRVIRERRVVTSRELSGAARTARPPDCWCVAVRTHLYNHSRECPSDRQIAVALSPLRYRATACCRSKTASAILPSVAECQRCLGTYACQRCVGTCQVRQKDRDHRARRSTSEAAVMRPDPHVSPTLSSRLRTNSQET